MSPQRRPSVPKRVRWALEQLALAPTDRVLEIGSGASQAVALAAQQLPGGSITAMDRSALQVSKARALNRTAIAEGRANIVQVSLEDAPEVLGEGAFAKIFAINVNAFWTAPGPHLASLLRLLQRKGRAYLVYEPPSAGKLDELGRELPRLLDDAGFVAVQCRKAPPPQRLLCVSGAKR